MERKAQRTARARGMTSIEHANSGARLVEAGILRLRRPANRRPGALVPRDLIAVSIRNRRTAIP